MLHSHRKELKRKSEKTRYDILDSGRKKNNLTCMLQATSNTNVMVQRSNWCCDPGLLIVSFVRGNPMAGVLILMRTLLCCQRYCCSSPGGCFHVSCLRCNGLINTGLHADVGGAKFVPLGEQEHQQNDPTEL